MAASSPKRRGLFVEGEAENTATLLRGEEGALDSCLAFSCGLGDAFGSNCPRTRRFVGEVASILLRFGAEILGIL